MNKRRIVWTVVLCATLCALFASRAVADPANPGGVPDSGAPPVASGPLVPGGSVPVSSQAATPVVGPLASQILTQRAQVEALGERLLKLDQDIEAATQAKQSTYQAWQDAKTTADQLQQRADNAAAEAYKQATRLGPWGEHANDLHQLTELVPGLGQVVDSAQGDSRTVVIDAATAAKLERTASAAYDSALATEQRLIAQRATLTASHDQQAAALADLMARNTKAVAEADAAQIASDLRLARQLNPRSHSSGLSPNPIPLAAVPAAPSKPGSPYVWGTEGPITFDCPG